MKNSALDNGNKNGNSKSNSGTRHSTRRTRGLGVVAALTLACGAGASFFSGSGTALAPEPAKLSVGLVGSTGATGAAVFVNTTTPTKVVFYSPSWIVQSAGPAEGTPCSSSALAKDAVTTHVIQVYVSSSNYTFRRCF
jgi:hypothetical protein